MIQFDNKYLNDIKFNGSSVNRIYLDGEVYWGNDPNGAPVPPTPGSNTISGTASVTSTTISNALKINDVYYNVDVDNSGNWSLELTDPVNFLENCIQSNSLTSIDFRGVVYDTYCDLSNMFLSQQSRNLTDIYFDFSTSPNTNFMSTGGIFHQANARVHGFGTLNWSGVLYQTNAWRQDPTVQNCFSCREFFAQTLKGTIDIRGIDTKNITDSGWHVDNWTMTPNISQGYYHKMFYNGAGAQIDTVIIGYLKILETANNQIVNLTNTQTLYITTTDPTFLSNSGFDYIAYFTGLQNIYVPVGSLNDYVNDSAWAPYISIMSEQNAPDPLTI